MRRVSEAGPQHAARRRDVHRPESTSVRRTLLLITGLWAALLLGASVLWPMGLGYDEAAHVEMAYEYSIHPFHFYGPGQLPSTRASEELRQILPRQAVAPQAPWADRIATVAIEPRSNRPTLRQLGENRLVAGSLPDQMVQHPPLYYELAALVLRIPGVSGLAWDLQIWLMRLLSVMLLLPVPLLAWATTRRLTGRWGRLLTDRYGPLFDLGLVAAVLPLTIPNLIRDGSAVTNDSLLIAATSALIYLLSRVVTGDLSYKTAAWVSVFMAADLLTKGFALVLPPVVLASYMLGSRSNGGRFWIRGFWKPLGVAVVGMIAGGLWWLRNLIDYGAIQVNGFGSASWLNVKPDNKGTLLKFLPRFVSVLAMRPWGGVGNPDIPSPGPFIIYGWLFLVLIGLVAGLLIRRGHYDRRRAVVLVLTTVLSLGMMAAGSYSTFRHYSTGVDGSQGRYLYQTVVAVAAVAAIGWGGLVRLRHRAVMLPVVTVATVLTNAAVWMLILRDWYQPATAIPFARGLTTALHAVLRWSPLPSPITILLVGLLPTILSLTTVGAIFLEMVRHYRLRSRGWVSPVADEPALSLPEASPV